MPSASRPHHGHTASSPSTGSITSKGKEKDPSGSLKWAELEEGEIPHVEFGVLEVPYRSEESAKTEKSGNGDS